MCRWVLVAVIGFLSLSAGAIAQPWQSPAWRTDWWRNGATLDMDFANNRYMVSLTTPVTYTSLTQFITAVSGTFTRPGANETATGDPFYLAANQSFVSRATSATYFDSSGGMQTAAANVARTNYIYNGSTWVSGGTLIEPARTNYIDNGSFAGGVPGVVSNRSVVSGSGVIPTKWTPSGVVANSYNLNTEVVGLGTINGMTYIDLRYYGTSSAPSGSLTGFYISGVGNISTSIKEPWAGSVYLGLVGGSTTNISGILVSVSCRNSEGNGLEGSSYLDAMPSISSAMIRYSNTWTCSNTSTTYIAFNAPQLIINSGPIDITLRIAAPQLEKGTSPTSYIATSGSTVTRAADVYTSGYSGTYFDASGTLRNAPANTPRLDYDPSTSEPKGVLIEEARTNLLPYSSNISTTNWIANGSPTFLLDVAAPDGRLAYTINSTAAFSGVYKTMPVSSGVAYSYSSFFKHISGGASLRFGSDNLNAAGTAGKTNIDIDASSGAIIQVGPGVQSYTVTSLTNGWYRLAAAFTASGTTHNFVMYNLDSSSAVNAVWGAQIEQGAFPTSYIPTSGSTVTRPKDDLTIPTSGGWYNASAGTLGVEALSPPYYGGITRYPGLASIDDGTVDNAIQLYLNDGASSYQYLASDVWTGGVRQVAFYFDPTHTGSSNYPNGLGLIGYPANTLVKGVIAVNSSSVNSAYNGLLYPTGSGVSMPPVNTLRVGSARGGNSTLHYGGAVRRVWYMPTRQPDYTLPDYSR